MEHLPIQHSGIKKAKATKNLSYVHYANIEIDEFREKLTKLSYPERYCGSVSRFIFSDSYCRNLYPTEDYLNFLSWEGINVDSGKAELYGYRMYECSSGSMLLFPVVEAGRYNAWYYHKRVRNSASRSVASIFSLPINYITFAYLTYPYAISQLLFSDYEGTIEKCKGCVKLFIKRLGELKGGRLGCQENLHLWKSETPYLPHLHHHLDILGGIVVNGDLKELLMESRNKPFNHNTIRGLWYDCIEEVFGSEYLTYADGSELPVNSLNIKIEWLPLYTRKYKSKVMHKVKYRKRSVITDLMNYYGENKFVEADIDKQFAWELLHYPNRSNTYGFWCRLKRWVDPEKLKVELEKKCPLCSGELHYVGFVPLDNVEAHTPVVEMARGGFYVSNPPPPNSLGEWNCHKNQKVL